MAPTAVAATVAWQVSRGVRHWTMVAAVAGVVGQQRWVHRIGGGVELGSNDVENSGGGEMLTQEQA